ncbi:uncharacterized protein C8A04DRAFT_38660 [Dichotomopilus funicola]|uniref:Potassium channel tetramerisation-type BTB domain-containing protein n=1 Tax=Dichotomopilus funicola TaxID=1934379 RepID=A0AAN6V1V4_9PEZI|nr:hypothetical protein C8A04DRAFT_38660 [Dichotomopilus funicola]
MTTQGETPSTHQSTLDGDDLFFDDSMRLATHHIPNILPHERVFPVQLGSELFKLSGASISSDAPSYFSQYFKCQIERAHAAGQDIGSAIRTLYIDRDPVTFRDISLHLQGYHVQPRDATHFVRLFADAQFYHLPKLVSQLYEESIFTSIGSVEFRIPRDLFADPGNSPNFFTLGFSAFFSHPGGDVFPGLDREGLLRPPSIVPPSVEGRSPEIFAQLIHLLRGYPIHIRNETHRAELLRDCRYFNFKGLEQKVIPCATSFNLARGRDEIVLRLRDILKSGISVVCEPTAADPFAGWVNYARPYTDDKPAELVLEVGDESTRLQFAPGATTTGEARAEFFGEMRTRVTKLLELIATKLSLPPTAQLGQLTATGRGHASNAPAPGDTPLSEDLVKVVLDADSSVTLDGKPWAPSSASSAGAVEDEDDRLAWMTGNATDSRKRRRVDEQGGDREEEEEWIIKTGQWRLRIQGLRHGKSPLECCLVAVKLDAYSSERARNGRRSFLGG